MAKNQKIYIEHQRFFVWWLLVLFLLAAGITVYSEKVAGILIILIVFGIIFLIKLRTQIDEEGIHIHFFPFVWRRTWIWDEIEDVYVKKYSPWEYGGWGYRFGRGGTAYTTKGTYGIQIILKKNGKHLLLGTQNPEEVRETLKYYRQNLY